MPLYPHSLRASSLSFSFPSSNFSRSSELEPAFVPIRSLRSYSRNWKRRVFPQATMPRMDTKIAKMMYSTWVSTEI